jgi:hypothetical protein
MRLREAHVPILLWVCAAAMIHMGGAHEGEHVMALEEGKSSLRQVARSLATPVPMEAEFPAGEAEVEITPEPQTPAPEAASSATPESSAAPTPSTKPKPDEKLPEPPKEKAKPEPKKPEPKKPEPEKQLVAKAEPKKEEKKPEPEKKDEAKPEEKKAAAALPPPPVEKKIAVQQIQKKDEEKNDSAKFLAEKNHHVKPGEETQASITSLTENNPDPNPGTNSAGPTEQPGNGDKNVVAQDQDRRGEKAAPNVVPKQPTPAMPEPPKTTQIAPPPGKAGPEPMGAPKVAAAPGNAGPANVPPQGTGAKGAPASAPNAPDEVAAANGAGTPIAKPSSSNVAVAPSSSAAAGVGGNGLPKYKLPELPSASGGNKWVAGIGANFSGKSGDPTSLKPNVIAGAVGQPQLDKLRVAEAETRVSKHRGEWKSALLERWKPAIENYVPNVKPGNQTNLGTRAAPFATYLTQIHNRLHPIFSDGFVDNLGDLPKESILRDTTLVAWMEIVLKPDGTIHHLGIVRPSGSTIFDIAALDSVDRAAPFGAAPKEIVSPDGLVYLHWEFHNDLERCSTANAHPYILDDSAKSKGGAPEPNPKPPTPPVEKGEKKTGALPDRRHM